MNTLSHRTVSLIGVAGAALILIAVALPGFLRSYGPWGDDGQDLNLPSILGRNGTSPSNNGIVTLEDRIASNPDDLAAHLALADAYLQRVRETGDPSLYGTTERVLDRAAQLAPDSADVRASQATLANARHEFQDALRLANEAIAIDPERARFYGVAADAQLELGMYDEALVSLQAMVDRRPDFASYSRIAYARELHGDTEGAIESFGAAIEAGSSAPENMAWAFTQVGNLYWTIGNTREAGTAYDLALQRMADHPAALAGQGRLAAAAGDLDGAALLYQDAFTHAPLAEYAIALGDVYRAQGNTELAGEQDDLVVALDTLQGQNGVNTDMELALFLVDRGTDPAAALERAQVAYDERPSVHGADVLAWALHGDGRSDEALPYAEEALRLGTQDSLKLFHAGMIALATGDNERAEFWLSEALRLNPEFSLLYADEARDDLADVRAKLAGG